jgi:glycosyltransferase involved in cell wall biosynthesis
MRVIPDSARSSDVLIVIASFQSGGAEKVLTTLANSLSEHRSVTLMVIDPDGPLRDRLLPGVQVISLDRRRARQAAVTILRSIRRWRPAVVLSSQTHLNILLAAMRPLLPDQTRLIVREAELRAGRTLNDRMVRLAHRTVYRGVALVLATSTPMADDLRRRVRSTVELLHNPLDEDALRRSAAPSVRHPGPGRRFVHLGRFAPGKGATEAVEVFATIARPDDHLSMVGDGPELPAARAAAARHGLQDQVHFHGFLPDPSRILAGGDVLILPSHREGMPNVALEALALGTPVLATEDLTTLSDLVATTTAGSVSLVPRSGLGASLGAMTPNPPAAGLLRPSLLPPHHRIDQVTRQLLVYLTDHAASESA